MINGYQQDTNLIMNGTKPRYLVAFTTLNGERMHSPFVSAELAIKWHNEKLAEELPSIIIDLTEYDWDENPLKISLELIGGNPKVDPDNPPLIQ